jgi:hypothetical protein
MRLHADIAPSYLQEVAETRAVTRVTVCLEVAVSAADEESVRWAIERATERAAVDAGAEVLRAVVTSDPY